MERLLIGFAGGVGAAGCLGEFLLGRQIREPGLDPADGINIRDYASAILRLSPLPRRSYSPRRPSAEQPTRVSGLQ